MSYHQSNDVQERKRAVGTALATVAIGGTVLLAVTLVLSTTLSNLFFSTAAYSIYFKLMGAAMFFEALLLIGLLVLRVQERAVRYVSVVLSKFLIGVGLNVLFIVGLGWGVQGILLSMMISPLPVGLYVGAKLIREIRPRVSLAQFKSMVSYGMPLMFGSIINQVMSLSDRYFIQFMVGSTELGLYSLGCRFGMIVNALIVAPFMLAWGPFFWAVHQEPNAMETYARVTTYYLLIAGGVALIVAVLGKEAIQIMATPEFYPAHRVVPLISLAWVIHGLVNLMALGVGLAKKTKWVPAVIGIGTVINLGLNFLRIPMWGMMGAAVAIVVAFTVLPLGLLLASRRYYKVPYEWLRMGKIALAAGAVFGVSLLVSTDAAYVNAIIKGMVLLAFPVVLYVTGFFEKEELQKVRELIRR